MKLSGLIAALITPYKDGALDIESLESLSRRLIAAEVSGLFALGTTGEFQYLSLDEKRVVIDTITKTKKNGTKILVGVTSKSLEDTVDLAKYAEEKQADAVVIAPEYQQNIDSYELIMALMKETSKPIYNKPMPLVLYNYPEVTNGKYIPFEVVRRLSKKERVVGIKDSSSDLEYFSRLLGLRAMDFGVLLGSERFFQDNPNIPRDGLVSGTANLIPGSMKRLIEKKEEPDDFATLDGYLTGYMKFNTPAEAIKNIAYEQRLIKSPEMVNQK